MPGFRGRHAVPVSRKHIAVVPLEHPERWLSKDEAVDCVEQLVLCAQKENGSTVRPPQFVKCELKNGGLLLAGASDYDTRWIEKVIRDIMIYTECPLIIGDPYELEEKFRITGTIAFQNTVQYDVYEKINKYNPELDTKTWRLMDNRLDKKGTKLLIEFEVDEATVKQIKQKGNRIPLDVCGLTAIEFHTTEPANPSPNIGIRYDLNDLPQMGNDGLSEIESSRRSSVEVIPVWEYDGNVEYNSSHVAEITPTENDSASSSFSIS